MTRLIDADSIPWLVEGVGEIPVITKEEIEQMPTIDAEPVKHGKWIVHLDRFANGAEYFNYGECSECHDIFYGMETIGNHPIWDYCPSCGARMEEE